MPQDTFPPNCPEKLIALFHKEKDNFNALGRRLGVSPSLVWKLIVKGIEPKDRVLRRKVFLTGRYREPIPEWVNQGADILADLEKKAQPSKSRVYNRKGKRVK